ncbi:NADP-dependent isocitrate dehydrogenase [Vagococcus elongatus]|uniref:Isocitrate dehydrogenase [NADP] n=1 Tax=Vagococcus elongatus TaxID=180344 RepID=A0A430B5Z3_9ENTE|nr:NADP-dependent isocitrate dehydrogenase [Vagococcus elongatus]RSU15718.1 NADP-dependent isocitrate dehydrogenase [Vagococcus elongatus]
MSEGKKITKETHGLRVNDYPIIPFIEGDGTGPEIWQAAQSVFDAAVSKVSGGCRQVIWKELLAGEKAFKQTGEWLPEQTLTAIKEYLVAIKGPLMTPIGGGFRSLNVTMRQVLDLYVCLRPVRYFQGVPSPLKHPERTDMVIFRENTEDIYAGIEFANGTPEVQKLLDFLKDELDVTKIRFPESSSLAIKPVSQEGTHRLVKAAIDYALLEKKPSVTLVHKGNIMKYTEGGFKNWGYDIAEKDYGNQVFTWRQYEAIKSDKGVDAAEAALKEAEQTGRLIINDVIADNFLQQILLRPENFSVVATLNLNGDYISDALAAQVGGIGIAPGANINYDTGHAIFEATHGTAPDIAGLNKANPSSVILSGAMMFDYLGWQDVSQLIVEALEQTIQDKTVTSDFATQMAEAKEVSTTEFAKCVIANMS